MGQCFNQVNAADQLKDHFLQGIFINKNGFIYISCSSLEWLDYGVECMITRLEDGMLMMLYQIRLITVLHIIMPAT